MVPDHDGVTVPVDLKVESFTDLVHHMFHKCGIWAGLLVAKANERLPTKPLDSFKLKLVSGQYMQVTKRCEGTFDLVYLYPPKRNQFETFGNESHNYESHKIRRHVRPR